MQHENLAQSLDPEPGQIWLDYGAYKTNRKLRELLVVSNDEENVRVHSVTGGLAGGSGVPRHYFSDGTFIFQGFWAKKHEVLQRLEPPFSGHPLAHVDRPGLFAKLHGSADLVNAIVHSRSPHGVIALNREFRPVSGVRLETPVSQIPAGIAYLELAFRFGELDSAFYQRQKSAWYLVRTRMFKRLPPILRSVDLSANPFASDGKSNPWYRTQS